MRRRLSRHRNQPLDQLLARSPRGKLHPRLARRILAPNSRPDLPPLPRHAPVARPVHRNHALHRRRYSASPTPSSAASSTSTPHSRSTLKTAPAENPARSSLPHHPRRLLLLHLPRHAHPARLLHPLARDVLPRQRCLIHTLIRRTHRCTHQLRRNALGREVLLHTPPAELLILLAQPRVVRRKPRVAQVIQSFSRATTASIARSPSAPPAARRLHQPSQLALGAHLARQRAHRVLK